MTEPTVILPSWRPGATRDVIVAFLDESASLPPAQRFACFDNDGTLWCERPSYVQLDFLLDALRERVKEEPGTEKRAEFAAVLSGDQAAIGELGLGRIALALMELCAGLSPEEFGGRVREFMSRGTHAALQRPLPTVAYLPMIELLAELRARDFTVAIVTGGGTEFVRAISTDLYGVPPELVVGTLVKYELVRDAADRPSLRRLATIEGDANEGPTKVINIETQLGRRPILAAGNSGGDREMLEWACSGDGPSLALLVDHDDDAREFRYVSTAQTFTETEPITDVGRRLGWTIVGMARDWETVFLPHDAAPL
jgi:phosphoglycolate phosphatase-like HAD superfamily hydrolase